MTNCTKAAEWELWEAEIYKLTHACTAHLSDMVSDETTYIYHYKGGKETCAYMEED